MFYLQSQLEARCALTETRRGKLEPTACEQTVASVTGAEAEKTNEEALRFGCHRDQILSEQELRVSLTCLHGDPQTKSKT
jgi:hypothetical protein